MTTRKRPRLSQSGFVNSWPREKSITQCLRYSLENKVLTDVTFKVGREQNIVQAHRLILSIRSCVFEAMFNGPLAEQDEIVIPDVELDLFEKFLKYLYTDDVTMDFANATGLLYLSKKYDVKTLEQLCLTYLSSSMKSDNACLIMEHAHFYEEKNLKEETLTYILENGDAALKSAGVAYLCRECLVEIIQAEELNADEKSVFESVVTWSKRACKKQNKQLTPDNRREVLGEAMKHVRFPLLDQKYFVKNVVPMNVLTDAERLKIFTYWVCPDEDISPFSADQRLGVIWQDKIVIGRLTLSTLYRIPCSGNHDDGIMFSVSQNVSLLGFQLYGALDNTTQSYDIRAFITDPTTDDIIDGSSVTKTVLAKTPTYDVGFPRPIRLTQNKKYNLIVNINGPDSYYGDFGRSAARFDAFGNSHRCMIPTKCSFFDYQKSKHSNRDNPYTGVKRGQIPGLIFLA
ncbi:BTB/POZ domain-containing protein 2-like [Gigantopelta aegis]|uniref:BTB/POZ domain-containing protein 2-like n=1 Tax=Gigantopelta aegis TaxID=1735272 RepID=UPI001B887F2E|nr:BTB/POZ domain-containing protein 2-like [Gigantopelta aegis]